MTAVGVAAAGGDAANGGFGTSQVGIGGDPDGPIRRCSVLLVDGMGDDVIEDAVWWGSELAPKSPCCEPAGLAVCWAGKGGGGANCSNDAPDRTELTVGVIGNCGD